jgi:hypothetical protein
VQGNDLEKTERTRMDFFDKIHEPPPKIGWKQAWGMVKWGEKAGRWVKGLEVLMRQKSKGGGSWYMPYG